MKISMQWLAEWLQIPKDARDMFTAERIAPLLTMLGLEVSQISPVAGTFTGVVVAKVLSTAPHPEADRLTVCQVDPGTGETIQVVCGAPNVRTGLVVALAQEGAILPNGMQIKRTKLRNQASCGMLCSAQELHLLEKSDGILELAADAPLGVDLRTYLLLDDNILEIELTPNRGDCLSVLGVARELAAKLNYPLNEVVWEPTVVAAPGTLSVTISTEAADGCPLYMGRLITHLRTDVSTPIWMQERLRRAGIRPVHPVVDITQYVMLEYGQPLHAFDATQIDQSIQVRYAHPEETITLLDGSQHTLEPQTLLIADQSKPLALAGIMGGVSSQVTETTTAIWLESAFFAPLAVAGVARKYGLMTDASYRFERGVDPGIVEKALERTTQLLQDILGGHVGAIVQATATGKIPALKTIAFRPSQVERLIGLTVPETEIRRILTALSLEIVSEEATSTDMLWTIRVPSHRFDISIPEDLVEEVIRLHGYEQLPALSLPADLRAGHLDPAQHCAQEVAQHLVALGYHQSISYSFVDPTLQRALFPALTGLSLVNPLSEELAEMRLSLWPGLLTSLVYNVNRQQDHVALFESGRVFWHDAVYADASFLQSRSTDTEVSMVGAVLTGMQPLYWGTPTRAWNFYDLKGVVTALFAHHACPLTFEARVHSALHPGKSAALIAADGQCVGWCGVLHPRIAQQLDVTTEVILFECRLDAWLTPHRHLYQSISKFPQVRRDLALLVDEKVSYADIERVIRSVPHGGWFKHMTVFDVYRGTGIPAGQKSIAVALWMQSHEVTLQDDVMHAWVQQVVQALQQELSITLRDGTV